MFLGPSCCQILLNSKIWKVDAAVGVMYTKMHLFFVLRPQNKASKSKHLVFWGLCTCCEVISTLHSRICVGATQFLVWLVTLVILAPDPSQG